MLCMFMTLNDDKNDNDLFAELYYKYRNMCYNIAYSILKDKGRSEDAVHEAYLSLSQNFKKISEKSYIQMRNYLIIIVRNTSLRIYNKNKWEYPNENFINTLIEYEDVQIYVEDKDYQEKAVEALKKMDKKISDVLILKYTYNMKINDIADSLGITIENVKIRLLRGRKIIKKYIEEGNLK